jgi:hypothetical protein
MGQLIKTTLLFLLLAVLMCLAQVPREMNYQGYLTDANKNPITGNFKLTFTIYDAQSGGNTLWIEEHPTVSVAQGIFHVQLGSIEPLDLPFDAPYWLSIKVENDPELAPRIALSSVPYSLRAEKADSLALMPKIFWRSPYFYKLNISSTFQAAVLQPYAGSDQWVASQTMVAERAVTITGVQVAEDDRGSGDTYRIFLTKNYGFVGSEISINVSANHVFFYRDIDQPVSYQKGERIGLQIRSDAGGGEEVFIYLSGYCTDN